jgi:signal transduction histidine kinase
MKKKNKFDTSFKNTKFLILTFVFFSAAIFLEKKMMNPGDYKIDNIKIETKLFEYEKETDKLILHFKEIINNKSYTKPDSSDTWLIDEDFNTADKNGITILVYQNDTLKYWSGNSVTAPFILSESLLEKSKTVKTENGWYEIRKQLLKDFTIFGLIKIKNNFSYENKYLKNEFRTGLEIPPSVKLSPIPVSQGKNIKDINGEYVFSLVPVNKVITKDENSSVIAILFFLSLTFLLIFINQIFVKISEKKYSYFITLFISVILIVGRYFMMKYKFPFFFYSLKFFTPEIYAGNQIFPYLGDLLMNSFLLLFLTVNIFRIIPLDKFFESTFNKSKYFSDFLIVFFLILTSLYLNFIVKLIQNLINNSNISFQIYKVLDFNTFSMSAYIIIAVLLTSFIVPVDRIIKIVSHHSTFKIKKYIILISIILAGVIDFLIIPETIYYTFSLFFAVIVFVTLIRFFKTEYNYFSFIILIVIISSFSILYITKNVVNKQKNIQKILITQLIDERDDVAELLLHEIEKRFEQDTVLINKLITIVPNQKLIIHDYLNRKYFTGFWKKYKLTVTLCGNTELYSQANQEDNCKEWYANELQQYGHKIEETNFWFLDEGNASITYFGYYKVPYKYDPQNITLYIRLVEKLVPNVLGYPELLIDEANKTVSVFDQYSYAKYRNGDLISKSGKYQYDLADIQFKIPEKTGFKEFDQYRHYIFSNKSGARIVLSQEKIREVDLIISFAYIFVFFNLLVLISILTINYKFIVKQLEPDFKNRIQFSLIFILIISFLLFGAGTVYYAKTQEKDVRNKEMTEKIQSVLTELEHKLNVEKKLTPHWKSESYDHLDELLVKFSQVFFTDINLYDLNGFLLATSRPEIFQKGLISNRMNQRAFTELEHKGKAQFIQKENIGSLEYSSVYIPLKNIENKVIAYINLPYFASDNNLQKNISNLLITTINIYVVLFLITILIAVVISNQITKPLRMLQSKFKAVQLGKKHQEIIYNKKDEIGGLVKEYNLMVTKLEQSVKQLAESERESAWREMAKQIAHEIKNPLTPMKLSVQLLQRSWKDNKEDFEKRLTNVSQTLIEQIDTLSSIASEFSAFAKMPKPQDEEVDLPAKIASVVQLFENTKDVKIEADFHQNEKVRILADKEQLSRVFINIIKNGIQSIPEGLQGRIYIELTTYGNSVKVTIEDNGSGISESRKDKLFQPSFTTKTKGMGMGLAIVKNIINNANGEIWFESEEGKGTKFFVEFPMI